MENFILVVLTSSVIAGLVSLIVGNFLENRRYIKDKKFSFYIEYCDKLDGMFSDAVFSEEGLKQTTNNITDASAEMHTLGWKIRMLTRNKNIKNCVVSIVEKYEKFCDADFQVEVYKDNELAFSLIDEINELREDLINEVNKEINSIF